MGPSRRRTRLTRQRSSHRSVWAGCARGWCRFDHRVPRGAFQRACTKPPPPRNRPPPQRIGRVDPGFTVKRTAVPQGWGPWSKGRRCAMSKSPHSRRARLPAGTGPGMADGASAHEEADTHRAGVGAVGRGMGPGGNCPDPGHGRRAGEPHPQSFCGGRRARRASRSADPTGRSGRPATRLRCRAVCRKGNITISAGTDNAGVGLTDKLYVAIPQQAASNEAISHLSN
jgi:hypothetical protein